MSNDDGRVGPDLIGNSLQYSILDGGFGQERRNLFQVPNKSALSDTREST